MALQFVGMQGWYGRMALVWAVRGYTVCSLDMYIIIIKIVVCCSFGLI